MFPCVCASVSMCWACVCLSVSVCVSIVRWQSLLPSVMLHEKHWAPNVQTWSKDHTIMMAIALLKDDA